MVTYHKKCVINFFVFLKKIDALSYDNSCNDSPPLPKPNRKIPSSRYIGVQSTSFSVKEEDEYLTPVHKEDFVLNLERLR